MVVTPLLRRRINIQTERFVRRWWLNAWEDHPRGSHAFVMPGECTYQVHSHPRARASKRAWKIVLDKFAPGLGGLAVVATVSSAIFPSPSCWRTPATTEERTGCAASGCAPGKSDEKKGQMGESRRAKSTRRDFFPLVSRTRTSGRIPPRIRTQNRAL